MDGYCSDALLGALVVTQRSTNTGPNAVQVVVSVIVVEQKVREKSGFSIV